MAKKYLDDNGLLYFWGKLKAYFVPQTRTINGQALSSDVTIAVPTAGTGSNYPAMDGTRALGSNAGYARVDHVHPTDTSRAASSHTHGNITNAGALQTTDVAIANGDKIVVTDSSNGNKVARTSTAFDGSTTTKALTQKGTFETFVQDASYVHTDNNFTTTQKNKLNGIASGAEVNVQSDWDVTDSTSDAFIKNKPTIPSAVTVDSSLSGTSTNPVQNKVIKSALDGKVDTETGKGLSTNDYTTTEKNKLAGIEAGAQVNVVTNATSPTVSGMKVVDIYKGTTVYEAISVEAKGVANGVASLDANGIVPSSQLPSYVDDVIEAYPRSGATELSSTWLSTTSGGSALTPESGKIYVLMADSTNYAANSQFRWSGTTYVKLSDGGVSEITNAEIDTIVAS